MGWKAFPPHVWVAFVVFFWGVISTCQAAVQNWAGLMALRTLLAIAEAMYGPGVPLYLSYFYPRHRVGLRVGIFLAGSALANAYGGALAYGISQIRGSIGPWRILFIIEGLPTIIVAGIAFFFIPDSPAKCRFLNEREKEIAIDLSLRQPGDRSGTQGLQWKQVLGSLMDYRSRYPISSSLYLSLMFCNRLSTTYHVFRLERLLCLAPTVHSHHHIGDGSLQHDSVKWSELAALCSHIHYHDFCLLHQRSLPSSRIIRRRRRSHFSSRLHHACNINKGCRPICWHHAHASRFHVFCAHSVLGRQHACHRLEARWGACDSCYW